DRNEQRGGDFVEKDARYLERRAPALCGVTHGSPSEREFDRKRRGGASPLHPCAQCSTERGQLVWREFCEQTLFDCLTPFPDVRAVKALVRGTIDVRVDHWLHTNLEPPLLFFGIELVELVAFVHAQLDTVEFDLVPALA